MSFLSRVKKLPVWKKVIFGLGFSNFFVVGGFKCDGPSMKPTIEGKSSIVFVDYFSYKFLRKSFVKGDVVVALCPGYFYRPVCKRICALEGETVNFTNPYSGEQESFIIPSDHVWLLGDNAEESGDSRHYGPVQKKSLRGRVFLKLWPLQPVK